MPATSHFTSADFENVYEPAEDTYLFLDALGAEFDVEDSGFLARNPPRLVCELGPGSGVLSTFVLTESRTHFGVAVDINEHACRATCSTARNNDVKSRFDCIQGDLLTCIRPATDLLDVFLFNPPYVPSESSELDQKNSISLAWAGGHLGREVIDRFLPQVAKRLVGGRAVLYLLLEERNDLTDTNRLANELGIVGTQILRKKVRGEKLSIWRYVCRDFVDSDKSVEV